MYTYRHTCPACSNEFTTTRTEPYRTKREQKLCPSCVESEVRTNEKRSKVPIENLFSGEHGCFDCRFWVENAAYDFSEYWKCCNRGYSSIDGYADEPVTYIYDICGEHEK